MKLSKGAAAFFAILVIVIILCITGGIYCCCANCSCCPVYKSRQAREAARLRLMAQPGYGGVPGQPAYGVPQPAYGATGTPGYGATPAYGAVQNNKQ